MYTRFLNGLKEFGVNEKDISNWKYAGGNMGRHKNYFKMVFPKNTLPEYDTHCVCNQKIVENCYITNGNEVIIVGNCCIKKFIPTSTRSCSQCNQPHQNRLINMCNTCRIGTCDKCGKSCDGYTRCFRCKYK
jgi:hypothetical protein